jgi:hypothetical protein
MDRQRDWLGVSNVNFSTICSGALDGDLAFETVVGLGAEFSQERPRPCNHRLQQEGRSYSDLPGYAERLLAGPIDFLYGPWDEVDCLLETPSQSR